MQLDYNRKLGCEVQAACGSVEGRTNLLLPIPLLDGGYPPSLPSRGAYTERPGKGSDPQSPPQLKRHRDTEFRVRGDASAQGQRSEIGPEGCEDLAVPHFRNAAPGPTPPTGSAWNEPLSWPPAGSAALLPARGSASPWKGLQAIPYRPELQVSDVYGKVGLQQTPLSTSPDQVAEALPVNAPLVSFSELQSATGTVVPSYTAHIRIE